MPKTEITEVLDRISTTCPVDAEVLRAYIAQLSMKSLSDLSKTALGTMRRIQALPAGRLYIITLLKDERGRISLIVSDRGKIEQTY